MKGLFRLKHPYLTQGRNYPKHKVHYKWTAYEIGESTNDCDFHIDEYRIINGRMVLKRYNCLKYAGHGRDHSYDESAIIDLNRAMDKVGIALAWWKHIDNEFGINY